MKFPTPICLVLLAFITFMPAFGKTPGGRATPSVGAEDVFNLAEFGAVGDGIADDGPALQDALNAIAAVGGGTLFVPAGRYAIGTPVQKDFAGLGASLTILGVESSTPVPPPNSPSHTLTSGLDLLSEFAPRTGTQGVAIQISGLQSFLVKDITFIGQPDVITDAAITLALYDISDANVRHCEFYGLSSLVQQGSIVLAVRSHLNIEQSVFLGSTCASAFNAPLIQNIEWKGVNIADSVFADFGQRAGFYGKLHLGSPYSWINIGNAAAPENDSPRREALFRRVFLDEGGYLGISSAAYLHDSAPVDLLYITGLYMNVSNLATTGHYLDGLQGALIEKSHYGWSTNAYSAIHLLSVGNAILDQVECLEHADRIRADEGTSSLVVIDSVYNQLDSLAQTTRVITTSAPDEDPVQYVRQQFSATLGRDPDPAAHYYWSNQILQCGDDSQCAADRRTALSNYLAGAPQEKFALSGQVLGETGTGLTNVTVALTGSQNLTTETDANGQYHFSNLPTSGSYAVSFSLRHYTLSPASYQIVTPRIDQIIDSTATFNNHSIGGLVTDNNGNAMAGVDLTLSGSQSLTITTGADGSYLFEGLPAGGDYTVTPQKTSYTFSAASQTFQDLDADQNLNFTGTYRAYSVAGKVVNLNNYPLPGITVKLSGSEDRTATTDSDGNFSFTGLASEDSYTVTPMLLGHSFSPASSTFNSLAADQYQTYTAILAYHSINGHVTRSDSTALSGAILTLSGDTTRTAQTDAEGNYDFPNLPGGGNYSLTISKQYYAFSEPSRTFTNLVSNQTANFEASPPTVLEFGAASYSVSEGTRTITVTVTRSGDTSSEAEVVYSATDISADQGDDVSPVIGRLDFAPNETSKTFIIFITDDAYVEGSESMTLQLTDLLGGVLGNNSSATLTITDNDNSPTNTNPIDGAEFFVRQQYRDFLNRPPDDEGLAFWTNQILSCGNDAVCVGDRRMNVSAAFFLSIEFQETGFLAYRLYQASFGRPPEHLNEFLLDTRTIGEGVVVNAPGWQQLLESRKTAFIEDFVMRSQFTEAYPLSLTPEQFVNLLVEKTGGALTSGEIATAVADFQGATTSDSYVARARALRRVAENQTFSQRKLNPAFVLMQYFGYMQRNPDEAPDNNLDGYYFWLNKLEQFGGDFRRAEMVKSFLVSTEYRARFGTP